MSIEKVSKDTLINDALNLFCAKGYYNTSMQDIANACHIKKPSIYHYFSSKNTLLDAVIVRLIDNFNQQVLSIASKGMTSCVDKLNAMSQASSDFFIQLNGGYFINTLVFDQTNDTKNARKLLKKFFNNWIKVLAALAEELHGKKSQVLAEDYIAQIKGALFLSKATNNNQILERAIKRAADF